MGSTGLLGEGSKSARHCCVGGPSVLGCSAEHWAQRHAAAGEQESIHMSQGSRPSGTSAATCHMDSGLQRKLPPRRQRRLTGQRMGPKTEERQHNEQTTGVRVWWAHLEGGGGERDYYLFSTGVEEGLYNVRWDLSKD